MMASLEKKQKIKIKPQSVSSSSLRKIVRELRTIPEVESAYFSMLGSIVVVTEPLVGSSPSDDQKFKIGRFAIEIKPKKIRIDNLDYIAESFEHPNIHDMEVCWGDNLDEVMDMLKMGSFYDAILFTIDFLTLYPQENGDPYTDYYDWYEDKEKRRSYKSPLLRGVYLT